MNSHEFARRLMSDARKDWQNPEVILSRIGVQRGMAVVDLGCGPGYFSLPFASRVGATGLVYAVDSDPIMLNYLRDNIAKSKIEKRIVKIIKADVSSTSIPTRSADIVFFANVLHDLQDHQPFFEEVRRICKQTASVVDVDWKKTEMEDGPPLNIRLGKGETERILTNNGLEVVNQIEAGPYHYGFVCKLVSGP